MVKAVPGVLIYRLDDRLFFANANYVKGRIRDAIAGAWAPARWLEFDAEALNHVDATGVRFAYRADRVALEGINYIRLRPSSCLTSEHLDEAGVLDVVGEERLYPTARDAAEATPVPN